MADYELVGLNEAGPDLRAPTSSDSGVIEGGLSVAGVLEAGSDVRIGSGFINFGSTVELTIASGVITATQTNHVVDTESNAAADDLNTINGGTAGDILYLSGVSGSRTVTVKDGVGNLKLAGDFSFTDSTDTLVLKFLTATWEEQSRSDNT